MIGIAVDGPSGAGKSYLARQMAARLGYLYVDTGALYRAVGLFMLEQGIPTGDAEAVCGALAGVSVSFRHEDDGQHVFLNERDVTGEIRRPEVSMAASAVSAIPAVRAFLLDLQRDIAETNDVVMDGRDIGTVILPNAQVKIFLFANEAARAERRYKELLEKGVQTTLSDVIEDMSKRDVNDATRAVAPAVPAPDAVLLDNSLLDREGTIEAALAIVREKLS